MTGLQWRRRLRRELYERNMSQRDLARLLGASYRVVGCWMTGMVKPPIYTRLGVWVMLTGERFDAPKEKR
jgi:hypothetical protein